MRKLEQNYLASTTKLPNIQENSQNTQNNLLKIANKWQKYHLHHENYSPIERVPTKQTKWPKMQQNSYKNLKHWAKINKKGPKIKINHLKYGLNGSPCSMPP